MCIAERAHVRELKVILLLVLGQHECVRGKFKINFFFFLSSDELYLSHTQLYRV